MLITFRVSNFLSFYEEAEFSMLAGQVKLKGNHVTALGKNKPDALKVALIYGANASGKSNLLKAIDFARRILLYGIHKIMVKNLSFRFEKEAETKPSKFEFEIKIGEKTYAYGFSLILSSKTFSEEWLFEVKKSGDKPIFERVILADGRSKMTTSPSFRGALASRFQVYVNDLKNDQLLLQELHDKRGDAFLTFASLFNWFKEQLVVFYPESDYQRLGQILQGETKKEFSEYLHYFKTGIEDVDVVEEYPRDFDSEQFHAMEPIEIDLEDLSGKPYPFGFTKMTKFAVDKDGDYVMHHFQGKYRQKNAKELVSLNLAQESDGNRRLLDIIPLLIEMSHRPKTIFIDEIDRSLHPELTRRLLEVFIQTNQQPESQLILTTHESSLLDLSFLRRDEIWFAEKNADGESKLYSLEEFKPRFDTEVRKAYLQGRYGAIPFIGDV